jgi:hypothetical protein
VADPLLHAAAPLALAGLGIATVLLRGKLAHAFAAYRRSEPPPTPAEDRAAALLALARANPGVRHGMGRVAVERRRDGYYVLTGQTAATVYTPEAAKRLLVGGLRGGR